MMEQTDFVRSFMTLAAALAVLIWIWWKRLVPANFPSGPSGLPLFGSIFSVGKYPWKTVKKWSSEKYGAVMSVRFAFKHIVFLNTYETAYQAWVKQGSEFSGRAFHAVLGSNSGNHGIILRDYEDVMKSQKQFGLKVMKGFGFGRTTLEEQINDEALKLTSVLRTKVGVPFLLKEYIHNSVLNVITRLICSKRVKSGEESELYNALKLLFTDPADKSMSLIILMFPEVRKLPFLSSIFKRYSSRDKFVHDYLAEQVREHKKTFDKHNLRDFIDAFLFEQMHGHRADRDDFTDKQLVSFCRDLLVAGNDTTRSSILSFILILLHYPEHAEKIHVEIDQVFGKDGMISMKERPKTPFTCAFIQECLRFYAVAPIGLEHKLTETTKFQGYVLPKNTPVNINYWGVHHDEETWPEPEKFDPYRHIDEEGNFVLSRKVITFSFGPRFCFGESLARVELYVFFVEILRKFDVLPGDKPLPSLNDGNVSTLFEPLPFQLVLRERK